MYNFTYNFSIPVVGSMKNFESKLQRFVYHCVILYIVIGLYFLNKFSYSTLLVLIHSKYKVYINDPLSFGRKVSIRLRHGLHRLLFHRYLLDTLLFG